MRNIFRTPGKKVTSRNSPFGKRPKSTFVKEILDTDEDRVINQYNVYRNYISGLKGELLRGSAKLMGYRRRISA